METLTTFFPFSPKKKTKEQKKKRKRVGNIPRRKFKFENNATATNVVAIPGEFVIAPRILDE